MLQRMCSQGYALLRLDHGTPMPRLGVTHTPKRVGVSRAVLARAGVSIAILEESAHGQVPREKHRLKHLGFRTAAWVHDAVRQLAAEHEHPASEIVHKLLEMAPGNLGIKRPRTEQR